MALPHKVTRDHVIDALDWIDKHPNDVRGIVKYALRRSRNGKKYPPKDVIRVAARMESGQKFGSKFSGGTQTNNFLIKRKFEIWDTSKKPEKRIGFEAVDEDPEEVFREGGVLYEYKKHKKIERNWKMAKLAKNARIATDKLLECDVCGFSFARTYGDIGIGYIEAHHKLPLAKLRGPRMNKVSDLALLCANCHRMIPESNPLFMVEELVEIVNAQRGK
jgi:predicted HNH restriction endonuclease